MLSHDAENEMLVKQDSTKCMAFFNLSFRRSGVRRWFSFASVRRRGRDIHALDADI